MLNFKRLIDGTELVDLSEDRYNLLFNEKGRRKRTNLSNYEKEINQDPFGYFFQEILFAYCANRRIITDFIPDKRKFFENQFKQLACQEKIKAKLLFRELIIFTIDNFFFDANAVLEERSNRSLNFAPLNMALKKYHSCIGKVMNEEDFVIPNMTESYSELEALIYSRNCNTVFDYIQSKKN